MRPIQEPPIIPAPKLPLAVLGREVGQSPLRCRAAMSMAIAAWHATSWLGFHPGSRIRTRHPRVLAQAALLNQGLEAQSAAPSAWRPGQGQAAGRAGAGSRARGQSMPQQADTVTGRLTPVAQASGETRRVPCLCRLPRDAVPPAGPPRGRRASLAATWAAGSPRQRCTSVNSSTGGKGAWKGYMDICQGQQFPLCVCSQRCHKVATTSHTSCHARSR
jgi:hypothetical protein